MTRNLQENYTALKQKADQLAGEVNRAQGQLDGLLETLLEKFDCDTFENAEALLEELEEQLQTEEDLLRTELSAFEERWGDVL